MRRRRSLAGLVMALTAACASPPVDRAGPEATPAPTAPAPAPTTTTTVLVVPANLQDVVQATTMTERGRRLFLAATPTIEDRAAFAANCGVDPSAGAPGEARTHTQGCYAAGRIHLLATDRAEARELLYVVAAHELLHAVFASLGPSDRTRIEAELIEARAGNERLEERLKSYGQGPTLINEVHSILGSEFDGLTPALESHYAQFFTDRAAIVATRQRTLGGREDEIRRLRAVVDDLDARITTLKDGQEPLRISGDIRTYNANVAVINLLVDRYNANVESLNAQIEMYNAVLGG